MNTVPTSARTMMLRPAYPMADREPMSVNGSTRNRTATTR